MAQAQMLLGEKNFDTLQNAFSAKPGSTMLPGFAFLSIHVKYQMKNRCIRSSISFTIVYGLPAEKNLWRETEIPFF